MHNKGQSKVFAEDKNETAASSFDQFVDRLQENIFSEIRDTFNEKGLDRLRNPRFLGPLPDCNCKAKLTGDCGDTMEMFVKIAHDRVVKAAYQTDGCGASFICGSFAAELAHGKSLMEILDMNGTTVLREIGRFPREEEHCAHLAVSALQGAIDNYMRQCMETEAKEDD